MENAEFLAALAFGAFTIVVFAREQFERPSYSAAGDLARVVEVLSPRDLRRSRVYFSAYVAYVGALLLIYIALCTYATVPVLALVGFDADVTGLAALPTAVGAADLPIGYAVPVPPQPAGRSPALPLAISAAMVGLAPAIPLLQKAEEKLRIMAHRLSGIPTRLVDGARALAGGQRWLPAAQMKALGVSRSDIERHARYAAYAAERDGGAAFMSEIDKIIAFRAWFLDERIGAPRDLPEKVTTLATLIESRIRKLVLALDDLIGAPSASPAAPDAAPQTMAARWDEARRDADRIGFDICLLLMLYDEHGLPMAGSLANEHDDAARVERRRISAHVDNLLSDVGEQLERSGLGLAVWSRAIMICVLVAFVWGLTITLDPSSEGAGGAAARSGFFIGLRSALSSVIWYAPALFVALTLRDTVEREQEWRNMWTTNWSNWLIPYVLLFISASAFTIIFVVAHNLYWAIEDNGIRIVYQNFFPVILAALQYEGNQALVGPILAVALVAVIDAQRAGMYDWIPRNGLSWRMFLRESGRTGREEGQGFWFGLRAHAGVIALPLATATAMFLWATVSRGWASQTAARVQNLEAPELRVLFLNEPDMLRQGVLAFMIGFFCAYFVQNLVIHGLHRRSARAPEANGAPFEQLVRP